jgi:predicted ATPase/class 3 adenylate cyclase
MINRVGQRLGNYHLLRLLGRGSFAEVYLGEHLHLGTQAAIKVLHAHFNSEDSEQLRTEARLIARLVHPLILRILDFVVEDGIPFLIMEYAPGGTLRQRHPKGTLVPLDTVVSYVKQLAEALHSIHEQGWVHRDIKPENLVFGRNNEVLLTDFGLTIPTQRSYSQQAQEIIGTMAYMAPEQIWGHSGPASDQYALGIVVYEWLSGETPFHGLFQEITEQHTSVPPPSLRARVPTISPGIEQVVLKALAKDQQQRFANVKAFAMALEEAFYAESPGRTLSVASSEHPARYGQKGYSLGNLPTGTVTILFTDIEGSTPLLQQVGDRYTDVLAQCRQLLRSAFQAWNGYEVDTQGDSFFVAFARATDAVLAAVDAQRALAAHPWPESVAVRVRMGLHTGEPARTSEGYVGLDVHRAARIMSAAHGGQVLLSQTTYNLVEQDLPDDVSLRDLGEHRLKDLGRPRRLFQLVISDVPADFPGLKTLDTYPNNLPMQHTPFIGREQELAAVGQLLSREDVRLVTLTGPGGTGKTRLGVQVAAELTDSFADGVFFVNLAPVTDTALVMPTIAETLGMREAGGRPLRERLEEELQQKQMVLLLDNFEQVVSAAVQVVDLLAVCPKLKVLVTSREALHVRAEQEFTVPPFPLPDLKYLPDLAALSHNAAVALFVSRAQAVKPDFQVTNANARALVEICARLDGLPLAIELAAARMKLFSPQALPARLSQRLAVLTSGARDAPARQQTLRNTIEWSYHLLNPYEQRLFRRLSVFVGGFTLEAIETVHAALHDGSGQVLEGVASLIDKCLLQQTEQEGGEPRLVMLETIREYGQEVFAASGEVEVIQRAHAAYYLALVKDAAHRPTHAGKGRSWLEQLQREHENLRVALEWLVEHEEQEAVLQESGTLCWFWWAGGHLSEGQAFLARALSAGEQGMAMAVRAKGLNALGRLAAVQGDHDRADAVCGESLTLFRVLEDTQGIAHDMRNELAPCSR